MGIGQTQQFTAFLWAIFTGVLTGVLYDCFRILRVWSGISSYTRSGIRLNQLSLPLIGSVCSRHRFRERNGYKLLFLTVSDIVFFFAAGCIFCVFLFHAACGVFRWFYLFGCLVGFAAYYVTAGKLVMLSSEMLAFLLRAFLRYLWWILCLPFRAVRFVAVFVYRLFLRRVVVPASVACRRKMRLRYTRSVREKLPFVVRFSEAELLDD